jgi:rare lipoprotein A (peptidoglycan hydrolase)
MRKPLKEKVNMKRRTHPYTAAPTLTVFLLALWFPLSAYGENDQAERKAEAIAEKVEQKAERTEKAEGKQDLIKDKVTVKTEANGEPVVEQLGEASFYGKGFHGKKTASGEKFNQHELTAAHPALPLGTEAKVTNLETGKSVEVEINDRGPYAKGRDLDLSKRAAKELGMTKGGVAPVKIEAEVAPERKATDKK